MSLPRQGQNFEFVSLCSQCGQITESLGLVPGQGGRVLTIAWGHALTSTCGPSLCIARYEWNGTIGVSSSTPPLFLPPGDVLALDVLLSEMLLDVQEEEESDAGDSATVQQLD